MYKALENVYESVLINEMTDKVVDYITDHKEILPFDNIFGNANRIVIPLIHDEYASELLHALKSIKHFSSIDFDSKEVIKEIPLDPKYGQGKKQQRIKFGKAIQTLNIPDDKKQKYLDWLARYSTTLKDLVYGHNYSIVLSRAPIDVVRMSDHRNIQSCHRQGGAYFECAVQEAISGGAIAYLIHNDSLDGLSEEEFQADDLFKDSDRDIRGVEPPLARIRIRRIENNDRELAMPETRVYGENQSGFYNSVRDYIQSKQDLSLDDARKIFKDRNNPFVLRGGTYEDNYITDLLNSYFGIVPYGPDAIVGLTVRHHSDDKRAEEQIKSDLDDLEDQLAIIMNDTNTQLEPIGHVSYDMNYDDGAYAYISGVLVYDLSPDDFLISDDFYFELSSEDIERFSYNRGFPTEKDFYEYMNQLFILNIIGIDASKDRLTITFGQSEAISDSDEFRNFCEYMLREVRSHESNLDSIYDAIKECGYEEFDMTEFKRLAQFKEVEESEKTNIWSNVYIEGEKYKDYTLDNKHREILLEVNDAFAKDLGDVSRYLYMNKYDILKDVRLMLYSMYYDVNPKQSQYSYQNELPLVSESITYDVINFKIETLSFDVNYDNTIMLHDLSLKFDNLGDETFQFIDFVDEFWEHILNAIRLILIDNWFGETRQQAYKPKNYPQIKALYGKYIK